MTPRIKATLIGCIAPLLWATFPTLSLAAGHIPPFQLMAMTFSVSFTMSLIVWKMQGEKPLRVLKKPIRYWLIGVGGIFGFNAVYVSCLKLGPAADVFLITSIWPILAIILDSVILKERLKPWHIIGALSAFSGVILVAFHNDSPDFKTEYLWRYAGSLGAASIWASYSILNRKVKGMPDNLVGGFCGVAAILAFICHVLFEQTVAISFSQLPFIIALGLGPVGIAYYAWSYGTKYGDIRSLSILSFVGIFISISLLVLFGYAPFSWNIAAAAVLIIGGAAIGSMGMFKRKR
jgi:drug/metabolite transporter (DMT)-like permease